MNTRAKTLGTSMMKTLVKEDQKGHHRSSRKRIRSFPVQPDMESRKQGARKEGALSALSELGRLDDHKLQLAAIAYHNVSREETVRQLLMRDVVTIRLLRGKALGEGDDKLVQLHALQTLAYMTQSWL